MSVPVMIGNVEKYLSEISVFPLVTREEEHELAERYRKHGDIDAAHKLVTSNLRFVVKVAAEYRSLGLSFIDLIQEGNIGLMKAVKKFDPRKGYRLISYAVWWIRAQIHSFIIKGWSLVKMGTTQAQRKIFAKLRTTKHKLARPDGKEPTTIEIAKALDVRPEEVAEMEMRMAARDFSLDMEVDEESSTTHLDLVQSNIPNQEDALAESQEKELINGGIHEALETLSDKERYILTHRVMADKPMTLKEIGSKYKISRERVRQIEVGTLKKVRGHLAANNLAPA